MDADRLQIGTALAALRKLIADPEDTKRVFEIIRAMAGSSLRRGLRRFKATPGAQKLLDERRSLLRTLRDREGLAALPEGALGRAYFNFVQGERISVDGLAAASGGAPAAAFNDPELSWYGERLRDQHDLWHVVTQYGRDPFGEACLLAFTYAQTRNRGIGLIACAAAWKLIRALGFGACRAMWQGYRTGRHASWLPAQDWEALLALPAVEVRRLLAVPSPSVYRRVGRQARLAAAAAPETGAAMNRPSQAAG